MPHIRHFMRTFSAMIMFNTGGGLVLFGLAMADLARSPIPLVCVLVGAVMAYAGRAEERRAEIRLVIETAKNRK